MVPSTQRIFVMIGYFKDVTAAAKAKEVIDRLTEQVQADCEAGKMDVGSGLTDRYNDGIMDLLNKVKVYDIGPPELEQFAFNVNIDTKGNQVVIRTDESDITAFIKVLIDRGRGWRSSPLTTTRTPWIATGNKRPGGRCNAIRKLGHLQNLPGSADSNFEMLCRAHSPPLWPIRSIRRTCRSARRQSFT